MYERGNKWVNGLDSLRFVLALIVVLSHLHNPYIRLLKGYHNPFAKGAALVIEHMFPGVVAVAAFFIISGFVIHYAHKDVAVLNWRQFLVRRWVRVGLPMALVLVLSRFYGEGILAMIWSLYCELIYYTLYPLLCKLRIRWRTMLYVSCIISAVAIAGFILVENGVYRWRALSVRGISWHIIVAATYLPVWLSGVLLAQAYDKLPPVKDSHLWLSRLAAYLLGVLVVGMKMHLHVSALYTSVMVSPAIYLWLRNEVAHYKTHTPLKAIENAGQFSYSLYLWHLFIFALLHNIWPLNRTSYFVYLVSAIALAYLAYLVIERPSHKLARRLAKAIG